MRIPTSLLTLAVAAAFAGCGDDEGDDTSTTQPQAQTTVTETVTAPPPSTQEQTTPRETTEEDQTAPVDPSVECADESGNTIDIIAGDVTCDAARTVANGYDQQGDRVQEVDEFVCEGGNAQTRPIIFTCTGPGGEFTVSESD